MIDEIVPYWYYDSSLSRLHGKIAMQLCWYHRMNLFHCESVDLPHVGFHLLFITCAVLIGLTCYISFARTPVGTWCYFCLSWTHTHRMIALDTSVLPLTSRGQLFPAEWG
jgi:hypothetical protein